MQRTESHSLHKDSPTHKILWYQALQSIVLCVFTGCPDFHYGSSGKNVKRSNSKVSGNHTLACIYILSFMKLAFGLSLLKITNSHLVLKFWLISKKKKLALFSPQAQTFTVVNTLVGGRLQCKSGREGRRWPHTRACCPPVPDILSAFLKPNHVWHHCKELFQKGSLWREKADGDELGKSVVFSGFL